MRIFALRILKSWEYELVRFPSEYKIFNISFLSPRMLSSQISRKGFHFLKRFGLSSFSHALFPPSILFCFRRNKLKMIKRSIQRSTLNEYSYICFFGYIFEVSEQSYGPGSIKRNRRRNPRVTWWLVKRINRKSCGFRNRGTEVTGICAGISYSPFGIFNNTAR